MKTRKPKVGATVLYSFGLAAGSGDREAKVLRVWKRPSDIHVLAERYGTSVEKQVDLHRLRADLEIQTTPEDRLPMPFSITNVEYDETGRPGTWRYKA